MNIYNFPSCDLTLINVQLAVLEGKSRHQRIACIIVKSKHFKVFRSKFVGSQNTCISFLSSPFLDAKTMYICKFICDHTLFILLYLVITVFHLDQGPCISLFSRLPNHKWSFFLSLAGFDLNSTK